MRMFVMTVPNPGALGEGPEYRNWRAHYVWPFKFGSRIALVMGFAIGADIPRRQNKAAKECHKFVFHNLSNCFEVRVNFGRRRCTAGAGLLSSIPLAAVPSVTGSTSRRLLNGVAEAPAAATPLVSSVTGSCCRKCSDRARPRTDTCLAWSSRRDSACDIGGRRRCPRRCRRLHADPHRQRHCASLSRRHMRTSRPNWCREGGLGVKANAIPLTTAAAMSVPALAMRTTEKKRFRLNQRRVFICLGATDNGLKFGQIWISARLPKIESEMSTILAAFLSFFCDRILAVVVADRVHPGNSVPSAANWCWVWLDLLRWIILPSCSSKHHERCITRGTCRVGAGIPDIFWCGDLVLQRQNSMVFSAVSRCRMFRDCRTLSCLWGASPISVDALGTQT